MLPGRPVTHTNNPSLAGEENMEQKEPLSTGRRVWAILAIIISVLVLLLAASGTIGTWFGRSAAINLNDSLMEGVVEMVDTGRQGVTRMIEDVDEISASVGEVESAIDEVAQNVSDQGLVLTLMPPELEEDIVDTADNIGETLSSITSAVGVAFDLYKAVDEIPRVNLPKPDEARVQALDDEVQEIQNSVDQLAADIQEFRDGVASGVGQISSAVGEVNDRLESTSQNLSDLDNNLAEVQNRAIDWQSRFRTISTFAAIVVTLLLIWIIYAMVIQIQNYWAELKAERIKPDGNSS
jgi:methyl-accepting chemotaxis protein